METFRTRPIIGFTPACSMARRFGESGLSDGLLLTTDIDDPITGGRLRAPISVIRITRSCS